MQPLNRRSKISPTSKARDKSRLERKVGFIHMNVLTNVQTSGNQIARHGKILGTGVSTRRARAKPLIILRDQPRASSPINDNYFVNSLQEGLLAGSQTISQGQTLNFVKCHVAKVVHSAPGHSQKKELSPRSAACYIQRDHTLKYVKSVSCVTQLSCVPPVINVLSVAQNLPVGARLQNFWKTWLDLGAGLKVVQILKEGYTLPFRIRPKLTRSPMVISSYVNPHRNSYLLEALHQLMAKNAVELVKD